MIKRQELPISALIITLNEEHNIRDCLNSLNFCAERVVVDSGSIDKTRQIAHELGAKVYVHNFEGFRQQKQWALERCTKEWVICVDADERISVDLRDFIYRINLHDTPFDGFEIKRRYIFMGRRMGHSTLYPDYKLMLARRKKARWGGINPHAKFFVKGKTKKLPYEIYHYPWRDSLDYLNKQLKYSRLTAEEKFKAGNRVRLSDLTIRPFYTFFYRYFIRLGLMDGYQGFIISAGGAVACLAKYMFLWEICRNR